MKLPATVVLWWWRLTCPSKRSQVQPSERDAMGEAHRKFLASLSSRDRAKFSKCPSAAELMKFAQTLNAVSKPRGYQFLNRIRTFSDTLQPYFGVIELVIQSHPEIAAIAWGCLRLVLQVRAHHPNRHSSLHWPTAACREFCHIFWQTYEDTGENYSRTSPIWQTHGVV